MMQRIPCRVPRPPRGHDAWILIVLTVLGMAACSSETPTVAPGLPTTPLGSPQISSPTPLEPTASPTPVARQFISYRHSTGVFSISLPDNWDVLDDSTEQRLLVKFIPPAGYGSRVTIEITNEGEFLPENLHALIESYIHLRYAGNPAYTEQNRIELPDGRLQITFAYDDGSGAKGQETLLAGQDGSYFAALRVFLADEDILRLGAAMGTMSASFSVDPLASWGRQVIAINPAEILLVNTSFWQGQTGTVYYMGEVYNASSVDITDIRLRVAFCDASGVIRAETDEILTPKLIRSGETFPFGIAIEGTPQELNVCSRQITADPASPDPAHTTANVHVSNTQYNQWRRDLKIEAEVTNPALRSIGSIEIVIAVYNASGQIIGYGVVGLDATTVLEPGQSKAFEYTFQELGGEPDHLAVFAQAEILGLTNPSLAPVGTP